MKYYANPVNRSDKAGEERQKKYKSKDYEIDEAKKANSYEFRSDAYAEGIDYLGMDDTDRIRREKLKHETR